MAKFRWRKHRFSSTGIRIFHYARRLGKTRKIFELAMRDEYPTSFILCTSNSIARETCRQFQHYLEEHNEEFFADGRGRMVRTTEKRFVFKDATEMARDNFQRGIELRYSTSIRSSFYIDNIDNIGHEDTRGIAKMIQELLIERRLKAVTLTGGDFLNRFVREIFFEKILARNKKLYYYKQHEERAYNRYINFGTFSSRTDADAESCPGSLLAS